MLDKDSLLVHLNLSIVSERPDRCSFQHLVLIIVQIVSITHFSICLCYSPKPQPAVDILLLVVAENLKCLCSFFFFQNMPTHFG